MSNAVYKSARELYVALGGVKYINAYAAMCQIWLESAGTGSELALKAFNFAGIKATDAWKKAGGAVYPRQTKEFVGGREISVVAEFRKYSSPEHFFNDFAAKWIERRYADAGLQSSLASFWLCFAALANAGWATDPQYFNKLCGLAERFGPEIFGESWESKRLASLEWALETKLNVLKDSQRELLKKMLGMAATHLPKEATPPAVIINLPGKKKVCVGIDAGHGGNDPGAVNKNVDAKEKDINLDVALLLKQRLEKDGHFKIFMTRDDDSAVALNNRTKVLNNEKVDLVVSIHTNAATNSSATGFEAFTSVGHTKCDDLCDRIYKEWMAEFPDVRIRDEVNTPGMGKEKDFALVKNTSAPSALVELDFISNNDMARKLMVAEYKIRMAKALFYGIVSFVQANF